MLPDWLKWALPGMRLKRWIGLALAGICAINLAVGLALYEFLRPGHFYLPVALLALGLGGLAVVAGLNQIIREVATTLKPDADLREALFQRRSRRRGPKIVAIGGGTGLASLLRGLKHHSDNLTAIVTVADDGGSSGRLREELGVLPPGDIRNCLIALAGEERLLTDLFRFRFPGEGGLAGHAFGNLFLTALTGVAGDLNKAIQYAGRVLAVKGQVLPATMAQMNLVARFEDGAVVRGESRITAHHGRIAEVWCEPGAPVALPEAVAAIRDADAIILGPGSLYTSLLPHMLIPELRAALAATRAPKLYVCNAMTQPGETDGFTASDHLRELLRYGGDGLIAHVLVNDGGLSASLARYEARGQFPVAVDMEALLALGATPVRGALLADGPEIRHDPEKLARAVTAWLELIAHDAPRGPARMTGKRSPKPGAA